MADSSGGLGEVATLQAQTGLISYDTAKWRGWLPQTQRVFAQPNGLSTLTQLAPAHTIGTTEVLVEPQPFDCLLLWRNAAPRLPAWIGGEAITVQPRAGEGVFLPGGVPSRWISDPGNSHDILHMHFAPGFLARVAFEAGMEAAALPVVPRFADPLTAQLAFWLSDSLADMGAPSRLFWDSGALLLARRLLEATRDVPPRRALAKGGLAPWQLRRVTEALAAQADADMRLADLAGLVQLSPFHFARAFKQSTGLPPHRYQQRLRLERARAILAETDLPISEVAAAVGYESPQTLARLFRREFGHAPSHWRRHRRS